MMKAEAASRINKIAGLVTIDVEPDNVWANTHSECLSNVRALPAFQELCQNYGVRPTYLITFSVAQNRESANIIEQLLATGHCEVGAHPHLWETPPFSAKDRTGQAWTGSAYETTLLQDKLATLQSLLKTRFGPATSHRAGRYGLDPRQVAMLSSLGIIADTSVTPGLDWTLTGAPDYSSAPLRPYYLSEHSLLVPGDSALLEVPCTVRPGVKIGGVEKTRIGKALLGRLGWLPRWLRGSPSATPRELIATCVWGKHRVPHLNLMTHSSELSSGTSPYWKTDDDVKRHLGLCAAVFRWWQDQGVVPLTLTEFARAFSSEKPTEPWVKNSSPSCRDT